MLTRWDEWFSENNLSKDPRILSAPHSQSAEKAATAFLARGARFILDLACGVGRDTFYLSGRGFVVTGVDASFNGLRVAQKIELERNTGLVWITADAKNLPFKDRSFDGVYCFGLLHEFTGETREEIVISVLTEIKRLLRDHGLLILTTLAGEPATGLPAVQLYTRKMFEKDTMGLRTLEIEQYDDVGCTGRTDYSIWYGMFEK